MKKVIGLNVSYISTWWARLVCLLLLSANDLALAQTSFTDQVKNAKVRSSTELAASAKSGVDNYSAIISVVLMLFGFGIMVWGIFWVMAASRSEGRKEAKPGWVMILGGGVLGAGAAAYVFTVGAIASMVS